MPQFKLWLVANHAPRVRDDDDALWRRILRVPLGHTVLPAKRDPAVKATLRDPTKGGPAILAWMVQGCREWLDNGLAVPGVVVEATAAYRKDQDPLREFVAECCRLAPNEWTSAAELRGAYDMWVKEGGLRWVLRGTEWTERLRKLGCVPRKTGGVRGWAGIALEEQ